MQPIIQIENLTHKYGARTALDQLSLDVYPGEVLGLLGPNGAGKTTTVRLLNGLFQPVTGKMHVLGLDPITQGHQIRRQTGVLTETPALYERLTAYQNLDFFGILAGMGNLERKNRINELLQFFELSERAKERVSTYSKGMKQRLALARALLHHPALLFLDEPTSGLDPEAALQVHQLIASLRKKNGQTVFLATHHLVEAERLCDRLAILNQGKLLAIGTLDELREQVMPGMWVHLEFFSPLSNTVFEQLKTLEGVLKVQSTKETGWRVQIDRRERIAELVAFLVSAGAQVLSVLPQQVSLEEIYFVLQNQA
jgi:ABC-2 type transport system ATP-binding protein